jgi:hypothetical protein
MGLANRLNFWKRLFNRKSRTITRRPKPSLPLAVESLEDRLVPATLDYTQLVQSLGGYPHGGPTHLFLNFDGFGAGVVPYANAQNPGQTQQDIQEILFRTSEVFAPFNVQVSRMFGNANFDRGGAGATTIFIGDDGASTRNGVNATSGHTDPDSVDYPGEIRDTDHRPNSDGHDVAFVDPVSSSGGAGSPLVTQSTAQIVSAIAHEAGHTFGLAHVRTDKNADGSFVRDPAALGTGTVSDVMSYTDQNFFFANQTFWITNYNFNGTTTTLEPDGQPSWVHTEILGFDLSSDDIVTENTFTYLQTVLGTRPYDFKMHALHGASLDPSVRTIYIPQGDTLSLNQPQFGVLTGDGEYDVYSRAATATETWTISATSVAGIASPVLMIYDANGNLLSYSDPGSASLNAVSGQRYYFVVGARDGLGIGGYRMNIKEGLFDIAPDGTLHVRMDNLAQGSDGVPDTIDVSNNGNTLVVVVDGIRSQYDTYEVRSLVIEGSADSTTVTLHDPRVPVSVIGNSGDDTLIEDDRVAAVPNNATYQLTDHSIARSYNSGDLIFPLYNVNFAAVNDVRLIVPSTSNQINVQSLPAGSMAVLTTQDGPYTAHNTVTVAASTLMSGGPLNVLGGTDDDTLVIRDDSRQGSSLLGPVAPTFTIARDSVTYQTWSRVLFQTYERSATAYFSGLKAVNLVGQDVSGAFLGRSLVGREYDIASWGNTTALNITGAGGNDRFNVGVGHMENVSGHSLFDPMPIHIDGGGGRNTVIFDDSLDSNTPAWSSSPDWYVEGAGVSWTNQQYDAAHTRSQYFRFDLTPTNVQGLEVRGGSSNAEYFVYSTVPGVPVSVSTGSGTDTVYVGTISLDLRENVTLTGSGNDTLSINDDFGTPKSYTVAADHVQVNDATINYTGFTSLTLSTSYGDDNVAVQGTPAGTNVTVATGNGEDTMQANFDGLKGPLTVDGGAGTNSLVLINNNPGGAHVYGVTASTVTRDGAAPINYSFVATLVVGGSTEANVFNVESTAAGVTTHLGGGYSTDTYVLSPLAHDLSAIQGPVSIDGNFGLGGLKQVFLYDDQAPTTHDYAVSPLIFAGLIPYGSVLTRSGSAAIMVPFAAVNLDLYINQPANTVSVQPLPEQTHLTIHAGRPLPINAQALGVSSLLVDGAWQNAASAFSVRLLPGQHSVSANGYDHVYFTVAQDGTVDYAPALEGVLSGRGTTSLSVNGRAVRLNAGGLGVSSLLLDYAWHGAASALDARLLPGQHWLSTNGYDYVYFTVAQDGTISYDPAMEGVLSGRGTTSLSVNGRAVRLDASDLGVSSLLLDYAWHGAASALDARLLPGQHWLCTNGYDHVYFTVAQDGTISYDPAMEGILSGRGTTSLTVNGTAITLDIRALGVSSLLLDYAWHDAASALNVRLLPGLHWLGTNGYDHAYFTVAQDGTIDYDAALEGILSGRGTRALQVNGAAVQLDARALWGSHQTLDYHGFEADAPATVRLLPGGHFVQGYGGSTVYFSVKADGTVDYDTALEGVLTGRGTTSLTLQGRGVAVDATALWGSFQTLDYTSFNADAPATVRLLPGSHFLQGYGGATVWFTVNADGTVDYDTALEGTFTGRGTTGLTVQGRGVAIDATALWGSFQTLDYTSFNADAPATVRLLPGSHFLQGYGGATVWFTVNADGTLDYDAALEGAFTGRGTTALGVVGRTVTVDARVLESAALSLDYVSHASGESFNVNLLPGSHFLYAGSLGYVWFSVSTDGTIDYDASLDGILSGRGTATLTFLRAQ